MANNPKGISVGCTTDAVYVRVVGRGTYQNSLPLRRFAHAMIEQGFKEFVFDLGQCDGLDSTFLGLVAGIGLRLEENGRRGALHVVRASDHVVELFQTLGIDRLATIDLRSAGGRQGAEAGPASLQQLPESEQSGAARPAVKEATAKVMLESHENLIRADPRNAPRFQDVARFLRERLKRERRDDEKGGAGPGPAGAAG
jgi:anti-sigma B factor antagonist